MILIVGGAGYIGSHVNKVLNRNGYETVWPIRFVCPSTSHVPSFVGAPGGEPARIYKICCWYAISASRKNFTLL